MMPIDNSANNFYLDEIFDTQIVGDSIKIHLPEAGLIRSELFRLLKDGQREESWEFLSDIYQINFHKEWPNEKIQNELAKIIATYIGDSAPHQINISGPSASLLQEISRNGDDLKISNFENVIKEIFQNAILFNLSPEEREIIIDCENLINNALEVTNLLNDIIKPNAFFNKGKEESWINNVRKIAMETQKDVYVLLNSNKISIDDFSYQFKNILNNALDKLSDKIPKRPKNPLKLKEIEHVIANIKSRATMLNSNDSSFSLTRKISYSSSSGF